MTKSLTILFISFSYNLSPQNGFSGDGTNTNSDEASWSLYA